MARKSSGEIQVKMSIKSVKSRAATQDGVSAIADVALSGEVTAEVMKLMKATGQEFYVTFVSQQPALLPDPDDEDPAETGSMATANGRANGTAGHLAVVGDGAETSEPVQTF